MKDNNGNGKDIVDLLCEYDLYYETFKDDPNDPFCRPHPEHKSTREAYDSLSPGGKIVFYVIIAAIIVFALSVFGR